MRSFKAPSFFLTLFVLFSLCSTAQQKKTNYDLWWKKTDSIAFKKGLTQTALKEVKAIYTQAKKEGNEAQSIKALLYQLQLEETTTDNNDNKSFALLEKEIAATSGAGKSILLSILAAKYNMYFQQNRWKLYDRTQTVSFKKEDIATWGAADLHRKTGELYLASLKNTSLLQQTRLEPFEPLIEKGNVRYLRPTLYDLLAFRALDYFSSDERDVIKPAYSFEINDARYFAPAAAFARLAIVTPDTSSLYHKALLIYQQLLAFHAGDTQPDAFIDADILRIVFVREHGTMENKDSLYKQALMQVASRYENRPVAAQAFYLVAQLEADNARDYDPAQQGDDSTRPARYGFITAADICRRVLAQKEMSEGKVNCERLLKEIRQRELALTAEKVNIPGQPFRVLVSYRNISRVYLRVLPITDNLKQQLENKYDDAYWTTLLKLKAQGSRAQALPVVNDYRQHTVEIKAEALAPGEYVLLASADSSFSFSKNPLAGQYIYVSNISYVNRQDDYFILDRSSGQPLANASVQQWLNQYDYDSRKNKTVKGQSAVADKNGYVHFASGNVYGKRNYNSNMRLEVRYKNDRLFMDDYQYIPYHGENSTDKDEDPAVYEKRNASLFFFTDRGIYRPGQTLYFKGIALTKDKASGKSKLLTGVHTKVYLKNAASGQLVDSLSLTTSEYGSYSGKFRLPEGGLNGQYLISDEMLHGRTVFSVEEYKRPQFYVDYEKTKGSYRVNDSITVTGFAKAYAGNAIGGAQVKYRIERTPRFIYPWLFRRTPYPQGGGMEIGNGMLSTGADGRFIIRFKAIPDASVSKVWDPVFDYRVTADVTDINGETRSHTQTISVSYKALQLTISGPAGETVAADSLRAIIVSTKNTAGVFEPAVVTVTVNRLQAPARLIRSRYWEQPDQYIMTEQAFLESFPLDEYKNESDVHTWPTAATVWQYTDTTAEQKEMKLPRVFEEGWYTITATAKDKYGETVKDVKYVQLYNEKNKALPAPAYSWAPQKEIVAAPGQQASISIGSSATNLFVVQQVSHAADDSAAALAGYRFISLNNEKKTIDFPVTENDRGGFGVSYLFVKDNRFYSSSNTVHVPWTNKELSISYRSFRDKTLPGSEEKWTLTISGSKKEPVAGEMLAAMYDASLDQFAPFAWDPPSIWPVYGIVSPWSGHYCFAPVESTNKAADENEGASSYAKVYDQLAPAVIPTLRGIYNKSAFTPASVQMDQVAVAAAPHPNLRKNADISITAGLQGMMPGVSVDSMAVIDANAATSAGTSPASQPVIRKNFNEIAFFLPELHTDSAGNISFGFTIPEALTQWKFQAMAHTKDLAFGYSTANVVTQKPLMVQPNAPRFLREGDKMEFSAKLVNMTDKELTGTVQLELFNAATNQPADGWFRNMYPVQYFTVEAGHSGAVKFSIDVPYQYNSALVYRFVAKAGDNSDGEEASLPVLTNSMLVTESMPLPMRGNGAKNFKFEKLLQSGGSETLQQHALTVEFTTNPAWYAVQALPYLTDYPYECAEQTFNRYYANALASMIAGSSPKLQAIVEKWNTSDTAALLSNLQKNQELKSVLLEETPWVLQAKTEAQQKKNIALLFDMVRMSAALSSSFEKLKQLQSPNGGFVWFKGGRDDRYMTQYILSGIGHLKKLHALSEQQQRDWKGLIKSAIAYTDQRIKEDYDYLIKHKVKLEENNLGYTQVQYLYLRSLFNEYDTPGASFTAVNYYRKQSQQYWLRQNRYMQGMIALSLFRTGDVQTAKNILQSLKENAIVHEELGMYWKDNVPGYFWHQAPVETQSLLIEAFSEISKDTKTVDDLKTWLLKQKQVQNWKTTKATAEACYALLLQGSDWLNNTPEVEIRLGDKAVNSSSEKQEAGTGYFKKTFDGPFVHPSMGDISVRVASTPGATGTQSSWGAVYWQYFEHLDKITPAATPLKLSKKLFVEKNTDRGPVLEPIAENAYIKVGDKIKVRIELRVDRDMEYVHMKDMRASCMEPVNVLSGYKWQGGLGYYESTKDASTNFFFGWLPKGTYVFEYPLFVSHAGNFSNGVTSIQCMYAPEFSSHSEGVRVNVEQRVVSGE